MVTYFLRLDQLQEIRKLKRGDDDLINQELLIKNGPEAKLCGYPSIDKPWLKYYSDKAINTPMPRCTIFEFLWENNKDNPDDTAILYFGNKISYKTLFSNIKKTAIGFEALGIKQDDIVILATVTTPETIYAIYALNLIGAVANLIDPRTSTDGIRTYIEEVNAQYIIAVDAVLPKIEAAIKGTLIKTIIQISPTDSLPPVKKKILQVSKLFREQHPLRNCIRWSELSKPNTTKLCIASYKPNSCCVIVHTGGTTGFPKGVMLSNENLNASVIQCDLSGFDIQRNHRWLGVMPPFIAYGIGNGLHLPLCKGMTLIVLPKFDPNKYDELLIKYEPNHIAGVPSHYSTIVQSKKIANKDLSFLYSPVVGGDGTEVGFEKTVNSFLLSHHCKTALIKGYGMTEICAAVTATAKQEYNKLGSVGIPFTHSVVGIFRPDSDEELGYNAVGEICMKGPHIMLGYYHNPEETERILRTHKDGTTWLHSGDLGYMDEDGCLFIQGRIKRMIVRHDGFKVFPTMIEKVVLRSDNVSACCVVGKRDKNYEQGQYPVVFAVLDKQGDLASSTTRSKIKEACRQTLPEYAQPEEIYFIDHIPLTTIGKINYRELEEKAEIYDLPLS